MRVSSIAKYLQEIAWEHAENCGAGYHSLLPRNLLWILYGLKIEINQFPEWNDDLIIETWGKKYEKLFAYRDFEIRIEGRAEPCIKATSSWLLVDSVTHRPQRITPELHKIPALGKDALPEKPGTIDSFHTQDGAGLRKVVFSDIDIYNHVNNTSYIQYCIDASPGLQANAGNIASFDIRFIQESHLGDELLIKYCHSGQKILFFGENTRTGKEVFRACAGLGSSQG